MKNQWKINRETPPKGKKFYPGMGLENAMEEYRNKASLGVRWGCEFVRIKTRNNELAPIMLISAKFYIIEKDGRLNCLGNRVPCGYYVFKKFDYKITPEQQKTLQQILNS